MIIERLKTELKELTDRYNSLNVFMDSRNLTILMSI